MTVEEIISQASELPPVSEAALKLLKLLGSAHHDNEDVVKSVQYDSILTAKLLRACNSAIQGLREPIGSIDQAVLQLGQQEILRLVLALNVGGTMNRELGGYAVGESELWAHSITTALAAERIVEHGHADVFDPSLAFTAGLLHDIGKVVLNKALTSESQAAVRARIKEGGVSRPEAEHSVLGLDHAEVGAALLTRWRLPETIVEAVANHHHPPKMRPLPLSALTHVANFIAHTIGSTPGWDGYAVRVDEAIAAQMGLNTDSLQQVMIDVHLSLAKVRQFLSIR